MQAPPSKFLPTTSEPRTSASRLATTASSSPTQHIAVKLAEAEGVTLELVGGQLRKMTWAAVGARAAEHFGTMRPDIAFIGANGIEAHFGISTPGMNEAIVKTAIWAARRVVLLCDSAKFGQESPGPLRWIEDIDTLDY